MAFFAGLVDAVAGGGGLIQVPALFAAYPNEHPATLLSTNKVSAVGGTLNAARKYLRHVSLPWAVVLPAIVLFAPDKVISKLSPLVAKLPLTAKLAPNVVPPDCALAVLVQLI